MSRVNIKRGFYRCCLCFTLVFALAGSSSAYVSTMRDTGVPEPPAAYAAVDIITDPGDYTFLHEAGYLSYYYRDDRDVIMVHDKRNGYVWKTGLDAPFENDVKAAVKAAATDEEKLAAAVPIEDKLMDSYVAMANSLLTAEVYDNALNISIKASAAIKGVSSALQAVEGEPGHFVLDVHFTDVSINVKLHVFLGETGIRYEIYDAEITGEGVQNLAALIITPFLGASGGVQKLYNPESGAFDMIQPKEMIPGYVLVPDGSGALIRFRDNTASLKAYVGTVYGTNYADANNNVSYQPEAVPPKDPLAPVFGIAHGDRQAAFIAWADSGDENLEIIVSPEENKTAYTYAYPRFAYNRQIWQIYNSSGEGYTRLFPERNHFNISMSYQFLAGDGSDGEPAADYTGMALAYRNHLIDNGTLTEHSLPEAMPIHLDYLMADVKKDILGYQNVVTTTAEDVERITLDLMDAGLQNINAGMLGAQKGGVTTGKPWKLAFGGGLGGKSDFRQAIEALANKGADLYFTQDYATINSLQMIMSTNMAYHRSSWGVTRFVLWENLSMPVTEISFARPVKSVEWLEKQVKDMKAAGASNIGIDGISRILTGHNGSKPTTAAEAADMYAEAIGSLGMTVNAVTPNQYLWGVTQRFLNMPVLPTQYIIETDTVPFLQMVLRGTMEIYAPYANFSFYTQTDILQMIDYNICPSFVLTEQPAYLLADTNSSGYYSTSYELYRDIIISLYGEMADIYAATAGQTWVGRDVLAEGVVLNRYSGGTQVLINYTEAPVTHQGHTVDAQSAAAWEGGAL